MASIAASTSSGKASARIGQLWQFPLLLLSLGLFAFAGYLFIDPGHGLSIAQKIDVARKYIKEMRSQAAVDQLNGLLDNEKLDKVQEGAIHELLAEAIAMHQQDNRTAVPVYSRRIVEQTTLAMNDGVKPTAEMYRRLAEAHEALHQPAAAIAAYKRLNEIDPNQSVHTQRRLIELEISTGDAASASSGLQKYLGQKTITPGERAWAIGESAHLMIDAGKYVDARKMLLDSVNMKIEAPDKGRLDYWLGYCGTKVGQPDEADRYFRLAREQLGIDNPLDANAAYGLGKIAQQRDKPKQAMSFYQDVLTTFPESDVAPVAKLGRGVCRVLTGDDAGGVSDLRDLVSQMVNPGSGPDVVSPSTYRDEAVAGLQKAAAALSERANYKDALNLMALQQQLQPNPSAQFYAQLGSIYERRADQITQSIAPPTTAEAQVNPLAPSFLSPAAATVQADDDAARAQAASLRIQMQQQARQCLDLAGDAYMAYSRALTLVDDRGYGEALWKGIALYDRAGDLQHVIAALELFVAQRPQDPQTPDALLRLGRAYQAAGMFDKAIAAYQIDQIRYPESLSAVKSAVPLAEAYIAKGPEFFSNAETALLNAMQNPAITPEAIEFRQLLGELADLYYRTGRYEEAVVRLQEIVKRYPLDPDMGKVVFLMADSYRKSANLIENQEQASPTTRPSASRPPDGGDAEVDRSGAEGGAQGQARTAGQKIDPIEAAAARKDRLTRAEQLYDRVIDIYHHTAPTDDLGRLYLKLAHFYRADCAYDLGNYAEAIRLYDTAAFRYQNDPSCLAAYVQIVNAYCALGRMDEARTANERAKWLLKRMPASAFSDGTFSMPQKYWQQWLQWSSQSAQWNKPSPKGN